MSKRGRKPKFNHIILIKNLDVKLINKNYKNLLKSCKNNYEPTQILKYSSQINENKNDITYLNNVNKHTFINKNQNNNKIVTMKDYINYGCLPEHTDIFCHHCHHSFNTSPIGIPIEYVSNNGDIINSDYFLTKGIFCSFPCTLAYIKKTKDLLYRNSQQLLYLLYYKLYNEIPQIDEAPNWECLKRYGGNLTIDEFRK